MHTFNDTGDLFINCGSSRVSSHCYIEFQRQWIWMEIYLVIILWMNIQQRELNLR